MSNVAVVTSDATDQRSIGITESAQWVALAAVPDYSQYYSISRITIK